MIHFFKAVAARQGSLACDAQVGTPLPISCEKLGEGVHAMADKYNVQMQPYTNTADLEHIPQRIPLPCLLIGKLNALPPKQGED